MGILIKIIMIKKTSLHVYNSRSGIQQSLEPVVDMHNNDCIICLIQRVEWGGGPNPEAMEAPPSHSLLALLRGVGRTGKEGGGLYVGWEVTVGVGRRRGWGRLEKGTMGKNLRTPL